MCCVFGKCLQRADMANNRGEKAINVGVLSSSRLSVVQPFINEFKKKSHNNGKFNPILIRLRVEDLEDRDYNVDDVEAVVLLHSIVEGRFSLTDVPDARYNKLLPRLDYLFGPENVGVIAHSMPNFKDATKRVQMKVFEKGQPTTFKSSGCVIICGNIAEMPKYEWTRLTRFLALAPCQRKQHPSNKDEEFTSTEKSQTEKSGNASSQPLKLVIITSEGDSSAVEFFEKDIIDKKASCSITIATPTNKDCDTAWESAHAFALLLQEEDLIDLCKTIPKEIGRKIGIFRPLKSRVAAEEKIGFFQQIMGLISTEERPKEFEQFEYEVRGDSSDCSYYTLSEKNLQNFVTWLEKCYNIAETQQ